MSDLSKEQSAALVAALDDDTPKPLAQWVEMGVPVSCLTYKKLGHLCGLSEAGRIVAQQCKQRERDNDTQVVLMAQVEMLERDRDDWMATAEKLRTQQPYWRPIAECGELPDVHYIGLVRGYIRDLRETSGVYRDEFGSPVAVTHIEYLGPNPITVPSAPESEGT